MLSSSVRRSLLALLLGVLASCDSPTKPPPAVANVVVGPALAFVDAGGTLQMSVFVTDAKGGVLEGLPVAWEVLDTTRATISATGLVTAKPNSGTTDLSTFVRATVGGVAGISTLSVRPSVVASLDLLPYAAVLEDGDAPTLVVEARDAAGNLLTGRPATFQTRDATTATVTQAGVLTPVAFLGASNRTVRIVANIGAASDSITVTVAPTTLSEISIFPQQPHVESGWTKRLRIEGRTPGGSVVLGIEPTFSSSNTGVATVNTSGVVTTFAGVTGTSQIIADFGGFADTVTLAVDACGAAPPGSYPLEVRFYGPNAPSPSVEAAFNCAVNRIRAIIREPLAPTNINNPDMTLCTEGPTPVTASLFTGLIIFAKVDTIDGPLGVLGSAGPCYVRSTSRLPSIGAMRFDDDDMALLESTGRLVAVILHEMLHVIGIGTIWREPALNIWTGDVPNPGFLGLRARAACVNDHGGAGTCVNHVPIEDCTGLAPGTNCTSGTRLGHWREATFRTELMTGYVSLPGIQNPFSKMTIQALADLGYVVDPDQANDYFITGPSLMRIFDQGGRSQEIQLPAPRLPTHEIDPMGRVRPIVR